MKVVKNKIIKLDVEISEKYRDFGKGYMRGVYDN